MQRSCASEAFELQGQAGCAIVAARDLESLLGDASGEALRRVITLPTSVRVLAEVIPMGAQIVPESLDRQILFPSFGLRLCPRWGDGSAERKNEDRRGPDGSHGFLRNGDERCLQRTRRLDG